MPAALHYEADCEFCAIARGDGSAEIVAEGPAWIAFFPLNPATPGHTLVIPRAHVRNLWEAEMSLAATLMKAVVTLGQSIDTALHPDGMNLISSDGKTAEQTVFHLHLHVVPRWEHDGFGQIWPTKGKYEDANLENVADRIRSAYRASGNE